MKPPIFQNDYYVNPQATVNSFFGNILQSLFFASVNHFLVQSVTPKMSCNNVNTFFVIDQKMYTH